MNKEPRTLSVTMPLSVGRYVFNFDQVYHFALNDGDVENWEFWVLDTIKEYSKENSSDYDEIVYAFVEPSENIYKKYKKGQGK